MIKKTFYILIILYLIVIIKFFTSNYNITYKIDGYNITEKATNDYIYIEITKENEIYNYMYNTKRKLFKKRVKNILAEEIDNITCIKPNIKGLDNYFMCNDNNEQISYDIIKKEDNSISTNDNFKYFNNLNENEYIYIWKYDGFYYLNKDNYKSINIFEKDRYSNDLMIKIDKYIIFPYYDSNYLFNNIIVLNMTNGKYETISSEYKISYDSYIAGNNKNNIYLFDNKEEKLYEINYKKNKIKLIGDAKKGYIKYTNRKKEKAELSEYTKNKVTYFNTEENYININENYYNYTLNKNIKTKFFSTNEITISDSHNNNIYFIYKDNLYKYQNSKSSIISHYFEFNFNKNNNIFVYNE